MKTLVMIFTLISVGVNAQNYTYFAHLAGYQNTTKSGYSFTPAYTDENRYLVSKQDIHILIDYLEEKHNTKMIKNPKIKRSASDVYIGIVRKNSDIYTLSIVTHTNDQSNFYIQIFYKLL